MENIKDLEKKFEASQKLSLEREDRLAALQHEEKQKDKGQQKQEEKA